VKHPAYMRLTDREREVLTCLARGLPNREIADHLMISLSTVQNHLHQIFAKLEARNRTAAVLVAQQRGYCAPSEMDGFIDVPAAQPRYPNTTAP
jgi:DNA-binding NarL/FixJ family response regulator